jgi:Zn-dependent protease
MFSSWWVTDALEGGGLAYLLSHVLWVIASIVIHELAHGVTAIRCGDDTPIVTGHMTWNPAVHMGTFGLVMFALFGFAFGAMPVNPRRFRGRYDDAKVAFAGPQANLALALIACVALAAWTVFATETDEVFHTNVTRFFLIGASLNFALGVFNLIPVEPLDGSTILARFSTTYRNLFTGERARGMSLMLFILVFAYVSGDVWNLAHQLTGTVTRTIISWIS